MEELEIYREGIYKFIKNINTNKAARPENITGKIRKEHIHIC
jgi:sRNA-binding carbon storage regulator CsrA